MYVAFQGYAQTVIGNELIARGLESGAESLDKLAVVNMAYIAHGVFLALTDTPLLLGGVETWQYGPMPPDLYRAIRREFGAMQVMLERTLSDGRVDEGDDRASQVLDWVWRTYGHLTGFQLVEIANRNGTPWSDATDRGLNIRHNQPMSDSEIRVYYVKLFLDAEDRRTPTA